MSTPTSQLLSPSSASPDLLAHLGGQHHQHQFTAEPSLAGSSELHAESHVSDVHTSLSSIKTEYKSKFTPFDQYVYNEVTDSFVRSPSASSVAPSLADHLLLMPAGSSAGGSDVQRNLSSRASSTEHTAVATEPWYREVQRRNEKANEYRYKSEVGHSSATHTPHAREEYKRDHLISHLANNNNFKLPKDTTTSTSSSARPTYGHHHVSSARSTTRTPAQVRSKSQSTVRRTPHATTATNTTSKNLNLTPTRVPGRHPVARPSPSSTTAPRANTKNSVDAKKPLNTSTSSTSSRTATRLTGHQQEPPARPTSTTITNKRPATGTSRVTAASRQTSRQPISASGSPANSHRNNVSSTTSTRTPTSTQRVSHGKTSSSNSNRNPPASSGAPSPTVKSIKTPQAMAAAAAAAAVSTAAMTATQGPAPQVPDQPKDVTSMVKREPLDEETVTEKSKLEDVTSLHQQQSANIKLEPEEAPWIPARSSEVEEPTNFMFNTTETGNMLADELAEAELQRQKAHDQSYLTNESDYQLNSNGEELGSTQVTNEDEENQMYSIMPVVGETVSSTKGAPLETMSESLEAALVESYHQHQPTEPSDMQDVAEVETNKSSDEIAIESTKIAEASQIEVGLDDKSDEQDAGVARQEVFEAATNHLVDEVDSAQQHDLIEPFQKQEAIVGQQNTFVPRQEEWNQPNQETNEPITKETTIDQTRQESEISENDRTTNMEEQSHTEDDLNNVTNHELTTHQNEDERKQEHNLLETSASPQPYLTVVPDGQQELDKLVDPTINEPSDQFDESHIKEALGGDADTFVNDDGVEELPVMERKIKPELLMDVNNLLDEEARKKLEMSKKSELARKSSSPLSNVGEVLLSPTQLDLGSQEERQRDKYFHDDDVPILDLQSDQREMFSHESIEEDDFRLAGGKPRQDLQEEPASSGVNLLTTPKNSDETLPPDNNTIVGDTSSDVKQQKVDEPERTDGGELSEEDLLVPRETNHGVFVEPNSTSQPNLTKISELLSNQAEKQGVDETVDLAEVTEGLTGVDKDFETSFEKIEEEFKKEEPIGDNEIDSENNLNFSSHDVSPNLTQNESGGELTISTTNHDSKKIANTLTEGAQVILSDSMSTKEDTSHVEAEVETNKTLLDSQHDNLVLNGVDTGTKPFELAKADFPSGKQVDNVNKVSDEPKGFSVANENSKTADSGELDLMKQINLDSGYVNNNKLSDDDEAVRETSKTEVKQEEPLADTNSDVISDSGNKSSIQEEGEETHGELYRQLQISPKERKLSVDMDKNTLRRKLSSRSSSSTSSSHASSSASSSLERVVQNDIKSDYEELAARMTTDLIGPADAGGSEGATVVTDDLLAGSSAGLTTTTSHQQLADSTPTTTTTTSTNLLD